MLKLCSNFEKSRQKNSLFVQALQLFLYFDDSELEQEVDAGVVQELLRVFDVCRRADIVHSKVFAILKKIPLKINSDKAITARLKSFCYFCKIEKSSAQGKTMTNVSTHFLYQLMEFFELQGEHEYDGLLQTWMEELKELFGKKLLMESEGSDLEEGELHQSPFEINTDFNYFGDLHGASPEEQPRPEAKPGFFEFDFTAPAEKPAEAEGFGMSQGDFERPPPPKAGAKASPLDDFDFDAFDSGARGREGIPESPVKSSSKQSGLTSGVRRRVRLRRRPRPGRQRGSEARPRQGAFFLQVGLTQQRKRRPLRLPEGSGAEGARLGRVFERPRQAGRREGAPGEGRGPAPGPPVAEHRELGAVGAAAGGAAVGRGHAGRVRGAEQPADLDDFRKGAPEVRLRGGPRGHRRAARLAGAKAEPAQGEKAH